MFSGLTDEQLQEILERGGYVPAGFEIKPDFDTLMEMGGYIPESTNS